MSDPGRSRFPWRVPPAVWFFGHLAGGWALERWKPLPLGWTSFDWQVGTAIVLFGLAAGFAGWGIVLFQVKKTTVVPFGTASRLVVTGPFRLSRNPLYVALVATLAAFGLLLDSGWYVILGGVLAIVLDRLVIREEERRLAELFGEEYASYRKRVRRWL